MNKAKLPLVRRRKCGIIKQKGQPKLTLVPGLCLASLATTAALGGSKRYD